MRTRSMKRILWLSVFWLLPLTALGGRLFYLQILKNQEYTAMARHQRALTLPLGDARGAILDRHGEPLTDSQGGWGVGAFFPLMEGDGVPEGVAQALATVLGPGWDRETVLRRPAGSLKRWVATGLDEETARRVQALGLPGIAVGPVTQRYGPGALAQHLVGFINGEGAGQQGLEGAYNQQLQGSSVPALTAHLDGHGRALAGLGIQTMTPSRGKPPHDLHTTLDARVQRAVERALDRRTALRGAVVVMEPNTGDVLGMASRSGWTYQPAGGVEWDRTDPRALLNRALLPYPPGSSFKTITTAAALEAGQVTPEEQVTCKKDDATFSFARAVARSCNDPFPELGKRIGTDRFRDTILAFGFGTAPGGLPGEMPGNVPGVEEYGWDQVAFGQGALEVTPLQMARAYSAVANGGVLPPVRVVKDVKSPTGEIVYRSPVGRGKRVISRETAATLRDLLAGVTDPEGVGTGRAAWVAGAGSAGKTGTAEWAGGETAWFAGFLPLAAPKYVIVVLVENGGEGGTVAAPIFKEIGEEILATAGY